MALDQDTNECRWSRRYEKLDDQKSGRARRSWLMKKLNGTRVKGLKISRSRKVNWKPFSVTLMLSRKTERMWAGFVKRLMNVDEVCPAIVFSCQWGLPVLSHSSVKNRKRIAAFVTRV